MPLDAAKMVQRYQEGVQNGGQRYLEGVQDTQVDWASRLSNSKQKMVNGFQESMNNGKFEAGVNRRGTQGWKNRTVAKAGNYSASAQLAVEGYQRRVQDIVAVNNAVEQQLANMPSDTPQQREQRALANMRLRREQWALRNRST